MMKNWKKIAALLVVLVVFVAAFIFLNLNKDKLDTPTDTPTPTSTADEIDPVDIARDQIKKIILGREGGEIVLTKAEKEIEKVIQLEDGTTEKVKEKAQVWSTTGFEVDSSKVDDIALAAETLKTTRLIEEDPKDLTIYGLDNPFVTKLFSADGKEYSLEIGNKIPTGDGYYFRKGGTAAVYTIDSYKGDTLLYGKFDIMVKALAGNAAIVADDITTLNLTRDGKEVFAMNRKGPGDWVITSPIQWGADYQDLSKFLTWLMDAKVSEYIAENPADLKTYGLDKPKYVFDYTMAGKTYKLKLGSLSEEKYYAQLEGQPYVFTLNSSELTFIDLSLLDLTNTFIYIPNIGDVEKLVIEIDGRKDELLIKYDTGEEKTVEEFYLNGTKIEEEDYSLFKRYYQGAIGIVGTKIDAEAQPSGQAEIRLTYTMENPGPDGKVVVVELIPTPDGYGYYLMKNGIYSKLVMSKRQLDKDDAIRDYYKELIEGMKKE